MSQRPARTIPLRAPASRSARALPSVAFALLAGAALPGCSDSAPGALERTRELLGATELVHAGCSGSEPDSGPGWRNPEQHLDGTRWAWIEGDRAELDLLLTQASDDSLWLRVSPLPELAHTLQFEVFWNGSSLGQHALAASEQLFEFPLPPGAAQRGRHRIELRANASAVPTGERERPDARPISIKCDFALLAPAGSAPEVVRARGRELDRLPLRANHVALEQAPASDAASNRRPRVELAAGSLVRLPFALRPDTRIELQLQSAASAQVQLLLLDAESGAARAHHMLALEAGRNEASWTPPALDGRPLELVVAAASEAVELERLRVHHTGRATPIVFIVVDTLRADAITRDEVATPHIDRLAADGHLFARALSHAPMTLPSHTALFSSRVPQVSGVLNNGQLVPQNLPLASMWLREQGYTTAAAISLGTLKPFERRHGLDRGFDRYLYLQQDVVPAERMHELLAPLLETLREAHPFFLFAHYCDPHEPYDAHGSVRAIARVSCGDQRLPDVQLSQFSDYTQEFTFEPGTTVLRFESDAPMRFKGARVAGAGLSTSAGEGKLHEPLELYTLHVHNAESKPMRGHISAWVHDSIDAEEVRRRYQLEVEHVDAYVGALLDELRDARLYDEALIVFTSDHGEAVGERMGFVGHVEHLYDELIRVPLIVKLPRGMQASAMLPADLSVPVSHMDIVPSVLDALELPPLPGQEGRPWRLGGERVHIAETHRPEAWRHIVCITDRDYKLVHEIERDIYELYDLRNDPMETTNIHATRANERAQWLPLIRELSERGKALGDAIGELDPELRARLEAMGYVGGEK
jgi:arylsulfatase A-like enzyme